MARSTRKEKVSACSMRADRSRSRVERRGARFGASFVLLLATIVALFVAQVGPAFALARLAGAPLDRPSVSAPREGESVTSREAGANDVFTVKRAGRGVDRFGPEPTPPAFAALLGGSLASVAPLRRALSGPFDLVAWQSPGRHRARLMVFLI